MSLSRRYKVLKWKLKKRLEHYEARLTDLLYGRIKARGKYRVIGWVLRSFEQIFKVMVGLRLRLYHSRVLKQEYLGCMVIVVGNLTVGGTGKTPIVERIARELIAKGRKVAILSRGYKRKESGLLKKLLSLIDPEAALPVVVSDGSGKLRCDWKRAGDEPYMLAQNLPEAIVIVDKNRVKAGAYAIRKFGADTLLLDDGFQYLPLKSRLQLVLIDQSNPFGNGAMLPRGILREDVKALKRASFIFITKSDGNPPAALLERIKEHAPSVSPIVCTHAPKTLIALDGGMVLPLSVLQGAKVIAFSGIAVPKSFETLLAKAGAEIIKTFRFADHYAYDDDDLAQVMSAATESAAVMIVTTEKDAVRVPTSDSLVPIYYLRMEVEILSGSHNFHEAVEQICFPKDPRSLKTPALF